MSSIDLEFDLRMELGIDDEIARMEEEANELQQLYHRVYEHLERVIAST